MKLQYAIKFMSILFCIITTCQVVFIGACNLLLGNDVMMSMQDLMKLPLISFASVLPTLIFVRTKTKTPPAREEAIFIPILHFALTAGIVFGLLIYFGFMDVANAAILVAFFLAIYIPAFLFQKFRDKRLARLLNERINAFHNADSATRDDAN